MQHAKLEENDCKSNALEINKVAQDTIPFPAVAQLFYVSETGRQTAEFQLKARSKTKSEPVTPTACKGLSTRQPPIKFQALDLKTKFCPMVAEESGQGRILLLMR